MYYRLGLVDGSRGFQTSSGHHGVESLDGIPQSMRLGIMLVGIDPQTHRRSLRLRPSRISLEFEPPHAVPRIRHQSELLVRADGHGDVVIHGCIIVWVGLNRKHILEILLIVSACAVRVYDEAPATTY